MKPIKKEICEPNSSLAQTSGSCQPERDKIFEIKPVKQEICEPDVFKSNSNPINPSLTADKDTRKSRFQSYFVPTQPKTEKIISETKLKNEPNFEPIKREISEPSEPNEIRKQIPQQTLKRPRSRTLTLCDQKTTIFVQEPTKMDLKLKIYEYINTNLAKFKTAFYAERKTKKMSSEQFQTTVIETLKKCNFKYRCREKKNKTFQFVIKSHVVSEGDSQDECFETLVAKLGEPHMPPPINIWYIQMTATCLRDMRRELMYTSPEEVTVEDWTKFVPKLLKFKKMMQEISENKMADLNMSVVMTLVVLKRCCVIACWKSYVINGNFVCDFILDNIIVSEGLGENECSAWGFAVQAFLAHLDDLIGFGCEKINRVSSMMMIPKVEKGIEKFVVFEFPDATTYMTLKHSAYLNGVELKFNRTKNSNTISLGTVNIGSSCTDSRADDSEALSAALQYLQANCFTVQVKSRMIYSSGVKTSEIESPIFIDWEHAQDPQIFSISKPVRSEYEKYINVFANTYYIKKLYFSPNFSRDEKQEITTIAKSLGLQVTTEDHDIGPLLVVMGKIHPQLLVQSLLVNGQAAHEYVLMPPRNWEGI